LNQVVGDAPCRQTAEVAAADFGKRDMNVVHLLPLLLLPLLLVLFLWSDRAVRFSDRGAVMMPALMPLVPAIPTTNYNNAVYCSQVAP
jgi:hypothetical protein